MEKIYVFGHRKPDTDSVCASIAMAHLLNVINENIEAVPRILSSINNETRFVLEKFGVKIPKYLNDVKVQIRDVNYSKNFYVDRHDTIKRAYDLMIENHSSGIPIVDLQQNSKLEGLITLKELAISLIDGDHHSIHTSYDNILKVLKAKEILRYDEEIIGDVLTATFRSTTFINQEDLKKSTILIIGDRHSVLEYAIESGVKLIILVADSEIKAKHIELAALNKVNIIRTDKDSFEVSNILYLANYALTINAEEKITTIKEKDYLTDFEDLANRLTYSNYPVVNSDGKCLGLMKIKDVRNKKRKKVVLVDHNEKSQSVDGLEEAEIVEIIDHHRLGTISTNAPINFRNMSVGCTCTIIFGLFKQYGLDIPDSLAGLMLSAILSDTLMLKSPTTTNIDVSAVQNLCKQLKMDYKQYGLQMFEAGSSLKGKTFDEIIYQDFKQFNAEDQNIGIGQIFTVNYEEVGQKQDDFVEALNRIARDDNYDIICLFVTDIIKNGSHVLFNDRARQLLSLAFNVKEIDEGYFLADVVSRKKQIISSIIDVIEGK